MVGLSDAVAQQSWEIYTILNLRDDDDETNVKCVNLSE